MWTNIYHLSLSSSLQTWYGVWYYYHTCLCLVVGSDYNLHGSNLLSLPSFSLDGASICTSLTIVDDGVFEADEETLTIQMTAMTTNLIIPVPSATVIIRDNDGETKIDSYSVCVLGFFVGKIISKRVV